VITEAIGHELCRTSFLRAASRIPVGGHAWAGGEGWIAFSPHHDERVSRAEAGLTPLSENSAATFAAGAASIRGRRRRAWPQSAIGRRLRSGAGLTSGWSPKVDSAAVARRLLLYRPASIVTD